MITVNSLSGGKTSSYMAVHYPADVNVFACVCIDYPKAAPKDPAILKYCMDKLNGKFIASAEHDDTLRVMMQLEQLIGKEIVWVRGRSFDEVINDAGCLPTWAHRFCTVEMKILPILEYTYFRYGKVMMNVGFRADEMERIIKVDRAVKENPEAYYYYYPISQNIFGKKRRKFKSINWREMAFPLGKTFHFEIVKWWKTEHPNFVFPKDSNCLGCHHKKKEQIKTNRAEAPHHLEWFAMQEEKQKFNNWHDDGVTYRRTFEMNFTELLDFGGYTSCDTGFCTD
jgi:hypothetical protein